MKILLIVLIFEKHYYMYPKILVLSTIKKKDKVKFLTGICIYYSRFILILMYSDTNQLEVMYILLFTL